MGYYWEPAVSRKSKSNGSKIIALLVILMILTSAGLVYVITISPSSTTPTSKVRVAILDSGIDMDTGLQSRIVSTQSFVTIENGYDYTDLNITDSKPEDVPHGTIIAKQIATSSNIELAIGKVLGITGVATTEGLVAAIYWAVSQNCSVINLSLGGSPTLGDPLKNATDWAFQQGVVVVAAAGNSGEDGVIGTSIESPALYESCLAVGALMEDGSPAGFSSIGPARDQYMKPDLVAAGYVTYSDGNRYYGTSFAAPRVAIAAAELIGNSIDRNITYTPGSIMTALLKGADLMSDYPSYVVGAGKLNTAASLQLILDSSDEGSTPALSYAFPGELPIDYECLFASDTYSFNVRILTGGNTTFETYIASDNADAFIIDDGIVINQVGQVLVAVNVPSSGTSTLEGTITFTSEEFGQTSLHISFEVGVASARVAFDIAHTPWDIDSIYGQFREFYKLLVDNDISVTEIRDSSIINLATLQQYDAVVILDPCAYDANETDPSNLTAFSIQYTEQEIQAYQDYYEAGGGIFIAALSNATLNVSALNDFLQWTGFSLSYTQVPGGSTPTVITYIDSHIITSGVNSFHYLGAVVHIPVDGWRLARYLWNMPVMGYKEDTNGGRLVVTGSNFMLDNYGLTGLYEGQQNNALLALRIVLWCAGELP